MIAYAAQDFDVDPARMAAVLVDRAAIERWSPMPFRVTGTDVRRLRCGDRLTVEAALVGQRLRFAVSIDQADATVLALRATGPFEIEARYTIEDEPARLSAHIETHGGGLRGRVFASAANALLSAGILDDVLARLVEEARHGTPPRATRTSRAAFATAGAAAVSA